MNMPDRMPTFPLHWLIAAATQSHSTLTSYLALSKIIIVKNPHAVALGRLGGKSRAKNTSAEQRKEWARRGGKARAKRHPKSKLSEWAKKGGRPPKKGKGR